MAELQSRKLKEILTDRLPKKFSEPERLDMALKTKEKHDS